MSVTKYQFVAFEAIETSLQSGEVAKLQVNGSSMRPYIRTGDWVFVEGVPVNEIGYGDIVIVKRSQDVVAHRVIGSRERGWVTKGDGAYQTDPFAESEDILGRVIGLERDGAAVDLTTKRRRMIHRWVARISSLEGRIFQWGVAFKRAISISSGNHWAGYLLKAILFPLRLLMRLISPTRGVRG